MRFEKEVSVKDYNVILDNCHQFTTGCITNEIENASTFFWMLKYTCEKHLLINNWRKWDYTKKNQGLDLAAEENLVKIQTMIAVKKKLQDTLLNDSWSALRKSFEHSTKRPEFGYFGYESRLRSWEEKDSKLTKISDNISDQLDSVGIEIQHLEQIENNILEALNN